MKLKKYLPPLFVTKILYIENSIAQSSASVSGGDANQNYQPEIEDWIGSDLNGQDGYSRGDI